MRKIIILIFGLFLMGCGGENNAVNHNIGKENIHVVLIGLDGWGSYSLENKNHLNNMPYVRALMSNGAYTLRNLSVMPSITAPNWESMFTGVTPDMHGIEQNPGNNRKPPLEIDEYGFFPSIFSVLKKQKPDAKIGYFYEKSGRMEYLVPSKAITKMTHIPDLSNDPNPISEEISYFLKNKPDLMCIIFQEPDAVGHAIGHDTEAYYEKLEILDKQIERIVNAVKNAGLFDNTVFILSADHGGIEKSSGRDHGGDTLSEREIPFIIFGRMVKQGHIIESEVNTYDTAATIAYILNISRPSIWIGKPVLEAFK